MLSADMKSADRIQWKLHFPCAGFASYPFVNLSPVKLLQAIIAVGKFFRIQFTTKFNNRHTPVVSHSRKSKKDLLLFYYPKIGKEIMKNAKSTF
jgi:hypothetical protein